jgi:hypothetical protein
MNKDEFNEILGPECDHLPRLPELVAAVNWDFQVQKRRLAIAHLLKDTDFYEISRVPESIMATSTLFESLREAAGLQCVALVGFDLPIGLPSSFACAANITNFRNALDLFESGQEWKQFYEPTDHPNLYQPFAPATPNGIKSLQVLAHALKLPLKDNLFRLCDRKTTTRKQTEPIFDLRFDHRAGRSVIQGWREVIGPLRDSLRIWPFDGALNSLLAVPGVVVVETYPPEAAAHLAPPLRKEASRNLGLQQDRAAIGEFLLAKAEAVRIKLAPEVRAMLASGCDSEADFNALMAIVSMIHVLRGNRPADPPEDPLIWNLEGWIFGQDHADYRLSRRPRRASVSQSKVARWREKPYFIRRIQCDITDEHSFIDLAYPTETSCGVLNVICGLNSSGKSFLLDQIWRVIKGKSHRSTILVDPLPSGQPRRALPRENVDGQGQDRHH